MTEYPSAVSAGPTYFADRYRLLSPLGSGAFGEVWRCHDEHQDEIVAVKIFQSGVRLDAVLTEARLQSRLVNHPHVVTVRNVITEPPLPLVAMNYLSGGSLAARIGTGDVPIKEGVAWIRDALAGLGHAHAMGVLHRDVKPANILLDGNSRAQLSDFGIAEDTLRGGGAAGLAYRPHRAPEVFTGPATPQSDVFASGCTLYRLLTGTYPFLTEAAILAGQCEAPHRANPQVPTGLSRIVMKALEVDPADRFTDAREMLAALSGCVVVNSWTRSSAGGTNVWACEAGRAQYEARIVPHGAGFDAIVRRDLGNGFRQVRSDHFSTMAKATQRLRRWLVEVVEGGDLTP